MSRGNWVKSSVQKIDRYGFCVFNPENIGTLDQGENMKKLTE